MTAPIDSDAPTYDNIPRQNVPTLLRRNLPESVRKLKAFVVFKFKPPKKPGGKRMKLPFYVVDGTMRHGEQNSKSDRTRLVTFDDALTLFKADKKWGGVGVCALESNPCFFVDLDNCFERNGDPNELAKTLLSWRTYTEYSPSGRGLRMIFAGNPGTNRKRHDLGLELFCTSGFVTLTGLRYDKAHADVKHISKRQQTQLEELLGTPLDKPAQDLNNIPSPITKERRRDINRALQKIDPDLGYTEWLMVGQALHSGDPDPQGWAFNKWVSWSMGGEKFEQTNEQEMLRKWNGFHQGKGVTVSTLFGIAKDYGFNPKELADNDNNEQKEQKPLPEPDEPVDDNLYPDAADIKEVETHPLAENLFDNHGAYMFIGRAKIGKSRILGALVAGALAGGHALNFSFNKKCKVLALTLEEDGSSLLNRVRSYMVEPLDFSKKLTVIGEETLLLHKEKYGDDYNWAQWLEIIVRKNKPDFMYVDTPVKLRMMWQNDPEYKNKQITALDYQNAAELDRIGQLYGCVIVSVIHGSKRKPQQHGFDPFESIGTTSWTLAGCTGALVLMDKPGHNPMEEEDDGQKVFSVRGRYQKSGDLHYLMQSNQNGTFSNMGDYRYVMSQVRAEEFLQVIKEGMDQNMEFVTARSIAQQTSKSEKHVHTCLRQVIVEGKEYEGRKLIAVQGSGYALVAPDRKGPTKRPQKRTNNAPTDEENVLRDRARRKVGADDDPLAL